MTYLAPNAVRAWLLSGEFDWERDGIKQGLTRWGHHLSYPSKLP
jgi:hypothetical protein